MAAWEGWYVTCVLVLGFGLLAKDVCGPDFVMMGMLTLVMCTGDGTIITIKESLQGFANKGLLTVVVLFVVAAGISETGGLDYFLGKLLGKPSSTALAQIRLMIPIAIISAFLNNTPVVAIMIPIVITWSEKARMKPAQLFMPLSFASILGGTITLIGTSTNLVIAGLQEDRFPDEKPIGLFDLSLYGVPVALMGMVYIVLFSPYLLPGGEGRKKKALVRGSSTVHLDDMQILVGLQVKMGSPVVGKTIAGAGLRGLDGLFLVSVKRMSEVHHAVGPEFVLAASDILMFTGHLNQVEIVAKKFNLLPVTDECDEALPEVDDKTLMKHVSSVDNMTDSSRNVHEASGSTTIPSMPAIASGLTASFSGAPQPPNLSHFSTSQAVSLLQCSIKMTAPIAGETVRDIGFRTRFNGAIVSIHRNGVRVPGKLGEVTLEPGDFLILDANEQFDETSDAVRENLENITSAGVAADREFMIAMQVQEKSRLVDLSVEAAGLRGLPSLFLVAIERSTGVTIHAVSREEILKGGDVLWFAGAMSSVASLRKIPGLVPHGNHGDKLTVKKTDRRLVQAVLAANCSLSGKTPAELNFRSRFQAAIIAIHRSGHRMRSQIGRTPLRSGDVLLLDCGPAFVKEHHGDRNFALVAEVAGSAPPRFERVAVACICAVIMIALYTADVLELVTGGLAAAGVMLLTGCLSGDAARRAIKWDVYITIAAAFGMSAALENSGVAKTIADALVSAGGAMGGDIFVMAAIYIATVLLSNLVANNAAAALMFPIAIQVADDQGIDRSRMSYLLMLGASACFASPFGYQTNLMVYGAGNYRFGDFVKFGGPMQIWQAVISLLVIILADLWPAVWAVTISASVIVFAFPWIKTVFSRIYGSKRRQSDQDNFVSILDTTLPVEADASDPAVSNPTFRP